MEFFFLIFFNFYYERICNRFAIDLQLFLQLLMDKRIVYDIFRSF